MGSGGQIDLPNGSVILWTLNSYWGSMVHDNGIRWFLAAIHLVAVKKASSGVDDFYEGSVIYLS